VSVTVLQFFGRNNFVVSPYYTTDFHRRFIGMLEFYLPGRFRSRIVTADVI